MRKSTMSESYKNILIDISVNRCSLKSLFILLFYRFSSCFAQNRYAILRVIGIPVSILYKATVEFVMGVEIPDKTRSGPGLAIYHGVGLVVNAQVRLGSYVTLRQCTTIGHKEKNGGSPRIGSNVDIGSNSIIIGDIEIGNDCIIGAGSVVTRSFPDKCVIAGNPAKIIKRL